MSTGSWPVRQQAYLWPCPACGTRNGLNARQCWRCDDPLPRPEADALMAAWDALAPEPRPASASVAVLPSVAVACGIVSRATVFANRRGATPVDPASVADAAAVASNETANKPRTERFGAVVADASSPRRSATVAAVGLAFLALVIAGYPIYRDTERPASSPEVRRAPFVPTAVHRGDAAPAAHPQAVRTIVQAPRPLAAPPRAIPPSSRPTAASYTHTSSAAPRHAAHSTRAAPHGPRIATARRIAPRAPLLVAGGVSMHDAALGR